MKSLSEIDTTSKRASRAVGFSWGESEEIGKSIRLLELFGFEGIKNLTNYYYSKNSQKFENLNLISEKNISKKNSFCPIKLGINFLDQIRIVEKFKTITFDKVAFPLLTLSFLSKSSEIIGKRIMLKFEKNSFLLNFNVNILSKFSKKELPLIAKKAEVLFLDNKDSFSESEWKNLYKLSENTFVEETDSLKKGAAGAGLTDND